MEVVKGVLVQRFWKTVQAHDMERIFAPEKCIREISIVRQTEEIQTENSHWVFVDMVETRTAFQKMRQLTVEKWLVAIGISLYQKA